MAEDLSQLCLHTVTNKPWTLAECARHYADAGVAGIAIWRDAARGHPGGLSEAGQLCRDAGLAIVSYVRGGFFTGQSPDERRMAVTENKRIVDEAAELGAPLLVLVCGATPGVNLREARRQITEAVAELAPHASAAGVKLGIEPLHPMFADSRSAVNTTRQALDIATAAGAPNVGVTLDVFQTWWDDQLADSIAACAAQDRLFSYHICDWKDRPANMLNDRGLMGEGVIDLAEIDSWVSAAGFQGFREVEIFSEIYWAMDQKEYLAKIIAAYRKM